MDWDWPVAYKNKNVLQIGNLFSEYCPSPRFPFFRIFSQQCRNILDTESERLQNGNVCSNCSWVFLQNSSNLSTSIFRTQLTMRATTLNIMRSNLKFGASIPSVLNKATNAVRISGLRSLRAVLAVSGGGGIHKTCGPIYRHLQSHFPLCVTFYSTGEIICKLIAKIMLLNISKGANWV